MQKKMLKLFYEILRKHQYPWAKKLHSTYHAWDLFYEAKQCFLAIVEYKIILPASNQIKTNGNAYEIYECIQQTNTTTTTTTKERIPL
jgi:hypothetical protein